MFPKFRSFLILLAGMTLGAALSLSYGAFANKENVRPAQAQDDIVPWEDARLLAEVFKHIRRDYVESIDTHLLMESAIRGMVSALDSHSTFLDNKEYDEIRVNSAGNYSGVGIELAMENGAVKIQTLIEGTSAALAGMQLGDIIISIDGLPVESLDLNEAMNRMRGKPGTTVKVKVRRKGAAKPLDFSLERTNVEVHSVKSELLEPGYGYVRIVHFSETTDKDLSSHVLALKAASPQGKLKGLILDLRNNPGGVLEAAVSVSDAFIDSGVLVTADGRAPESKFEMDATPGDILEGGQLVALVNNSSASSSEIVAGALKDHGRALLIGRTTFGKGSVQTVMPLADGHAIKLTTSRYYTPSGVSIQQKGIVPDLMVDKDQEPKDFTPGNSRALLQGDAEIQLALNKLKDGSAIRQSKAGKTAAR